MLIRNVNIIFFILWKRVKDKERLWQLLIIATFVIILLKDFHVSLAEPVLEVV